METRLSYPRGTQAACPRTRARSCDVRLGQMCQALPWTAQVETSLSDAQLKGRSSCVTAEAIRSAVFTLVWGRVAQ